MALTDPLADPDAYDPATQGCLVSRLQKAFPNATINPDPANGGYYKVQGGHAEFGMTTTAAQLAAQNFSFYKAPGYGIQFIDPKFGENGYRNNGLYMQPHVNGQNGSELGPIASDAPQNVQVHYDVGNSSAGVAGYLLHLVDVIGGSFLGGTALDPSCP